MGSIQDRCSNFGLVFVGIPTGALMTVYTLIIIAMQLGTTCSTNTLRSQREIYSRDIQKVQETLSATEAIRSPASKQAAVGGIQTDKSSFYPSNDKKPRAIQSALYPSWPRSGEGNILKMYWDSIRRDPAWNSDADLVSPDEAHLEGIPKFIQHPKSVYYTMKHHPATIECAAEPVSHAAVVCAKKVIPYKGSDEDERLKVTRLNSNNQPDTSGSRWRLALQVHTKEVEEWFDSYTCRCEVWNKVMELQRPKKVFSSETVIIEAYIDQKFQVEPVSTNLTVGERLVLSCVPPKGKPDPEVYWLKDGVPVKSGVQPEILINDYNQLIIENVTEHDSGNYTCVAECLAVEYRYAQATVKVFSGEQNTWQEWSTCSWMLTSASENPNVVKNICQQTRVRKCFVSLSSLMPVTTKNEQTSDERAGYPTCPMPFLQKRNCSITSCPGLARTWMLQTNNSQLRNNMEEFWKDAKLIVISGGSALFLVILLTVIAVLIFRRKQCGRSIFHQGVPSGCTKDHSRKRFKQIELEKKNEANGTIPGAYCALLLQPENNVQANQYAAANSELINHKNQLTSSPPLLRSLPQLPAKFRQQTNNQIGEQRTVSWRNGSINSGMRSSVEPQDPYCVYSEPGFHQEPVVKQPVLDSSTTASLMARSRLYSNRGFPNTLMESSSSGHSLVNTNTTAILSGAELSGTEGSSGSSNQRLPPSPRSTPYYHVYAKPQVGLIQSQAYYLDHLHEDERFSYVWGRITSEGGTLSIKKSDVSMIIPPNAFDTRDEQNVYLSIQHSMGDQPPLKENQTLLSPTVEFGPVDLVLRESAIVKLRHCAALTNGNWLLRLMGKKSLQQLPANDHCGNQLSQYVASNMEYIFGSTEAPVSRLDYGPWQELCILEQETNFTEGILCQLTDDGFVHLRSKVPQRFCLIGESRKPLLNSIAREQPCSSYSPTTSNCDMNVTKFLCFAAFVGPFTTTMDNSIRIYVLPNTRETHEIVERMELPAGGCLVDQAYQFPFTDDGTCLSFQIAHLSPGFRCRLSNGKREIPFNHVWSGTQTSMLHCAFSIEPLNPNMTEYFCKIIAYQEGNRDQRAVFHIAASNSESKKTHI